MVARICIQKMTILTKNKKVPTPVGVGESGTKDFLQYGLIIFFQTKKKSEMPKIFYYQTMTFLDENFPSPVFRIGLFAEMVRNTFF